MNLVAKFLSISESVIKLKFGNDLLAQQIWIVNLRIVVLIFLIYWVLYFILLKAFIWHGPNSLYFIFSIYPIHIIDWWYHIHLKQYFFIHKNYFVVIWLIKILIWVQKLKNRGKTGRFSYCDVLWFHHFFHRNYFFLVLAIWLFPR